jgi:hypothetical protein
MDADQQTLTNRNSTGVDGVTFFFPFLPALIVCFEAYVVASIFLSIYEIGISTNFVNFLYDCEINDGSPEKPYFMSDRLLKLMQKGNAVSKKPAKEMAEVKSVEM